VEVVQVPGARLTLVQRGLIGVLGASGVSLREIAQQVGAHYSTVSRELRRDGRTRETYSAFWADVDARGKAARPKPFKLEQDGDLRREVAQGLARDWSPQQVVGKLRKDHPDCPERWVSHTTIYRSIYLLGRQRLLAELDVELRTGRVVRRTKTPSKNRIVGAVSIAERPEEAADRVPGHWEGDLIMGAGRRTAVVTLVERHSRFVLLAALPHGRTSADVVAALTAAFAGLPAALARSLTWDRGTEMARHAEFTLATEIPVYFADPHSPWQRPSNENSNGLIRQYLPKGTDINVEPARLAEIAALLNGRPRKILDFDTPAEVLDRLLQSAGVATTP
jgi:IS30 family transposase